MPWCPKCKNEYYEGIKVCADCGCELVDSLEEIEEAERKEKEAYRLNQIAALREMLAEAEKGEMGAAEAVAKDGDGAIDGEGLGAGAVDGYSVRADGADAANNPAISGVADRVGTMGATGASDASGTMGTVGAADASGTMGAAGASDASDTMDASDSTASGVYGTVAEKRAVYQNYAEKAEDNKSSAYTLLGVGTIGLLFVILSFCDVIRLPLSESSKFLTMGVMGAIFLLFIVMGVVSMKNAGKYAKKAGSEKELTKELEKWLAEHVSAEIVDEGLFSEEEADFSEEQKYFKRFDKMKAMLSERFLNLDDGYMNRFLDEHYQDVFSEERIMEETEAEDDTNIDKPELES